jgi:hypothetical protein
MVTLNLQSFVRGTTDVLDRQTRLPLRYRTIKEREVNSTAIAVARGDTDMSGPSARFLSPRLFCEGLFGKIAIRWSLPVRNGVLRIVLLVKDRTWGSELDCCSGAAKPARR